jgi:hypothetical protein
VARIIERSVADLEAELRAARARLADAQRDLTTLNTRLESFATRYQVTVGHRFELLKTAKTEAPRRGDENDARAAGTNSVDGAARPERMPGHAEFESFYRDLARRVHPDLAEDPRERTLRTRIMAELNNAREALDFDRARQLVTAWELRSDSVGHTAGTDRAAYLVLAIERVEARFTAVTADMTRLQNSNLHRLLSVVEAQERAGIDLLAETAADLDRQIAEVRSTMSLPSVTRADAAEIRQVPGAVAVLAPLGASVPTRRVASWLAALVSVISLGILAVAVGTGPQDASLVITTALPTPSARGQTDARTTPSPAPYRVIERALSTSGRTTATVRIVVDESRSYAEQVSTVTDAARREIGGQQAVLILAYRSASEIGGPFTVGRAYLSVDGRGWTGDGATADGPDDGRVIGSIVVSIGGTIETRPFTARP